MLFLKVHRSGSSTVQNVLFRFAVRHDLAVWLPQGSKEHFSEDHLAWWESAGALPPPEHRYDIAFNHMVYNPTIVSLYMKPNISRVAILREPFYRFLSSFHYYRNSFRLEYLARIPGSVPIYTYLGNQQQWEHTNPMKSQTNNRMSLDFGLDANALRNETAIRALIDRLEIQFSLVMIMEMFDESMVLLKRTLRWQTRDILYTQRNSMHMPFQNAFSESQVENFAKNQIADYMLYRHFHALLVKKIEVIGQEFQEEVTIFKGQVKRLREWCLKATGHSLIFEATPWNERFEVKISECLMMALDERGMMSLLRHAQSNKTTHVGSLSDINLHEILQLTSRENEM